MTSQPTGAEDAVCAPERIVPPLWRLVVAKTNPITPLNEIGTGPSFYCVHPIAGDVSSFYSLAEHLNGSVNFYGIQVAREKMNATFGGSIEKMARHYVNAIIKHQSGGPIYLGGWSAGAIVALEMAQQLRQAGRTVPLLVAFDGAPCNTGAAIKFWNPVFAVKIIGNIPHWIHDEAKQAGSWRDLMSTIRSKLILRTRRSRITFKNDQTLHGDAVERLIVSKAWSEAQMAFIRAFYTALRTYFPHPYDGAVLAIESRTQPLLYLRQVAAAWKKISPSVEIVRLQSNHEGIFREPFLSVLAGYVLDRIRVEREPSHLAPSMPTVACGLASLLQDNNFQPSETVGDPTSARTCSAEGISLTRWSVR